LQDQFDTNFTPTSSALDWVLRVSSESGKAAR
jgi:hypothetical protein